MQPCDTPHVPTLNDAPVTPGLVLPGARTFAHALGTYWAVKRGAARVPLVLAFAGMVLFDWSATAELATRFDAVERSVGFPGVILFLAMVLTAAGALWWLAGRRSPLQASTVVFGGMQLLSTTMPGPDDLRALVAAGVLGVIYLAGIIAHEAAHAAVGVRFGLRLRGIVIAPWGAACSFAEDETSELPSWRAMVAVTIAGPLASAAAAVMLWLVGTMVTGRLSTVFDMAAGFNALLALLNALPVLPMDGGFVLAGLRWRANPQWTCEQAVQDARRWAGAGSVTAAAVTTVAAAVWTTPFAVLVAVQVVLLRPLLKRSAVAIAQENEALRELRRRERAAFDALHHAHADA